MGVERVLRQFTDQSTPVVATAVIVGERVHHYATGAYDVADYEAIGERVSAMLDALDGALSEDPTECVYMEFVQHGVIATRIDDALLFAITTPAMGGSLDKMRVALDMYRKPIARELAAPAAPAAQAPAEPAPAPAAPAKAAAPEKKPRFYRGIRID